jgi:DNA-binding transcriptional LysR family regulator
MPRIYMLDEMKAFVLLADTGSVKRSAERLRLTQPAVTRQIQRLEHLLRTDLLDRRVKPPALTASGLVVLNRARAVLASIDDLKQTVAADADPSGPFRMGVSHSLADAGLAEMMCQLRLRYPRLELSLASGWTPELVDQVEGGRLDAAILVFAGNDPDLSTPLGQVVGKEEIVIIAPKDLPLPQHPNLRQLSQFRWVLMPDKSCGARRTLQTLIERDGGLFRLAAEVYDIELQVSLIHKGAGIGILPRGKITAEFKDKVKIVRARDVNLRMVVSILPSPFLSNKGACVEFLISQCARQYGS